MSLHRYDVLGHLASGGMGEILLARRRGPAGFAKLVVLKRPLTGALGAPLHVEALIAEARMLGEINHANVCQVLDLEAGDDGCFLVLEYLEGLSLWSLLDACAKAGRRPELRAVCGIFEQACHGLHAIHSTPAAIVHRDISPSNLFVTTGGIVKILDLGIAKREQAPPTSTALKGKLPYLAPEQAAGKPIDRRADLFALGLALYDVARGIPPPPERIGALATSSLDLGALPAALASVIARAVAPEPDGRFATAAELASALHAAGEAVGGAYGSAELARWLATDHASAVPAPVPLDAAATRPLALRSLVTTDDPPAPHLPPATEALPRGPALVQVRGTAVAAHRHGGRLLIAAAAVLVVAAAGAWYAHGNADEPATTAPAPSHGTRDPSTTGAAVPVRHEASAPPAHGPSAPPTTAPHRPPAASKHAHETHPAAVATARLSIDSEPFAKIELDGRGLGFTPIYELAVAPGHHVIRAETAAGRSQQLAVDARSGEVVPLVIHW